MAKNKMELNYNIPLFISGFMFDMEPRKPYFRKLRKVGVETLRNNKIMLSLNCSDITKMKNFLDIYFW